MWATVSSWSCFCWLYRTSPSLAAKNITSLISVLTIWWSPCVESSRIVGRGYWLWPVCSLGKTLLTFDLLHSVLQGQICLLLQVFLDLLLLHSSPLMMMESTPVFLPGESHEQSSLVGYSPWQRVGHDWVTNTHIHTHTHTNTYNEKDIFFGC